MVDDDGGGEDRGGGMDGRVYNAADVGCLEKNWFSWVLLGSHLGFSDTKTSSKHLPFILQLNLPTS